MSQLKMFYTTCMINSVLEDSSLWMIGLDSLPKLLVSIFSRYIKLNQKLSQLIIYLLTGRRQNMSTFSIGDMNNPNSNCNFVNDSVIKRLNLTRSYPEDDS